MAHHFRQPPPRHNNSSPSITTFHLPRGGLNPRPYPLPPPPPPPPPPLVTNISPLDYRETMINNNNITSNTTSRPPPGGLINPRPYPLPPPPPPPVTNIYPVEYQETVIDNNTVVVVFRTAPPHLRPSQGAMPPLSPPVLLPVVSVERRENSSRRLREEFERGVGYNNNNNNDCLIDSVFSNWIRQEHEGGDSDGRQEDEGGDSERGERRENSTRRLRGEFEPGVGYNNNNDYLYSLYWNWILQEDEGGRGLSEETIGRCLKKRKPCPDQDREPDHHHHHHHHHDTGNKVCAVCLEDLVGESSSDIKEVDEDMFVGVLDCRHEFHVRCIKQWLRRKNACPLCRATALGRCE